MGCSPGAARRQYRRAPLRQTHSPAELARRHAVRRRWQSHDADPCDQERNALPLLSVYQAIRLADPSAQRRLIARTEEIGRGWPELPLTRQRAFLTALIERINVGADRIEIHLRPTRLSALLDIAVTRSSNAMDEAQILSVPIELRRSGLEIKMLIQRTDPFATTKPDARLIKLLIKAQRFNATLFNSDGMSFSELVQREGISPSYFTRLLRLSYLAPDIIQAILDGRQPRDLTADKMLEHSRLPLGWHEQRTCSALVERNRTQSSTEIAAPEPTHFACG